jgi:hypothetical protein
MKILLRKLRIYANSIPGGVCEFANSDSESANSEITQIRSDIYSAVDYVPEASGGQFRPSIKKRPTHTKKHNVFFTK